MKNIILLLLFLLPLNIIAQNIDFQFEYEYTGEEIPTLYLKCGNNIYFSVSDNTNTDKLSYSIRGGSISIKNRLSYLTIIPTHSKVTLEIFYDRKFIKEQVFQVKLIPKPTIWVRNIRKVITVFPQEVLLQVIANQHFKGQLPRDALYRINKFTIFLYQDQELIMKEVCTRKKEFTQKQIKKFTQLIKSKPTSKWNFMIIVSEVQRKNFQDEIENVPMGYLFRHFIFPIELE